MNRAPLIFLGIFFAMALSWVGIVLTNQISYGSLQPVYDENEGKAFPLQTPGLAARGKLVYEDLGCISCHSQQVRREGYGSDYERGWSGRDARSGSVARDYIRETRVLLGSMRTGPDLRNIGARQTDPTWQYIHLYDPQITSKGSNMPPFKFLFETRKIVGQPSPKAIQSKLPAHYQPPAGYEIVPNERGENLVAYMMSLKDTYAYPETKNVYVEPKAEAGKEEKK